MTPQLFMQAARAPESILPQKFGKWKISRMPLGEKYRGGFQWGRFTVLQHEVAIGWHNIHKFEETHPVYDVVMEDSARELSKHLPIWMKAHGRVLITGLGLGCVVRGLLASYRVDHIDVVEIDADILRIVGAEFAGNPRVTLHHGDAMAFKFPEGTKWDCAWRDLWVDEGDEQIDTLAILHSKLITGYAHDVPKQGAWAYPRFAKRLSERVGLKLIG